MASAKLITSLSDLKDAANQAAREGSCRIRLESGEQLVLVQSPSKDQSHVVTDAQEEAIVLSCLESGGKYFTTDEALSEVQKRAAVRKAQQAP